MEGENRELLAGMQPAARAAVGWLFNQMGETGSGVRQGFWKMDLGGGRYGVFRAQAIRDPNGFKRAFVTMQAFVPELEEEITVAIELRIEPGLLSYGSGVSFPLKLLNPGWMTSWAGVALPSYPDAPLSRLTGLAAYDEAQSPPVYWPDPTYLDGLIYTDHNKLMSAVDLPTQLYSGGARLWAESCIAAGVPFTSRIPSGCSTWYGSLGLIWAPPDTGLASPRPWVVSISSTGVRAYPLNLTTMGQQLAAWVWAGELSGATSGRLAIGYVLAGATPNEPAIYIECLSSSEIADAYAGGQPLQHGWHWRWANPWDEDERETAIAYITTTRESATAYYSRTSSVSITWTLTDGVYLPEAALTAGADQEWGGLTYPLHTSVNGGAKTIDMRATIYGSSATVYTWTTAAGGVSHLVREAISQTTGSYTTGTQSWPDAWYGAGSGSTSYQSGTRAGISGGWSVTGDGACNVTIEPLTDLVEESRSAIISATDSKSFYTSSTRRIFSYVPLTGFSTGPRPWDYPCNYENGFISATIGVFETEITRRVGSGGNGRAIACILYSDTGVVLAKKQNWTSAYIYYGRADNSKIDQRNLIGVQNPGGLWEPEGSASYHVNYYWADYCDCSGNTVDTLEHLTQGYVEAGYSNTPIGTFDGTGEVIMVTSSGKMQTLDLDEWKGLITTVNEYPIPKANVSYTGKECLVTEIGGEWECTDPAIPAGQNPVAWALG